jgi:hypothetical protein
MENLYLYLFIGFATGFIVGLIAGYFAGVKKISISIKNVIGLLVSFVWFIGMILSFINPNFIFPAVIHGIFGGVVASLYGMDTLTNLTKK